MRGMHVALFAAIVVAVAASPMDNARQSLQCKNIARDVIINSCKGPRIKRSADQADLSKMDQEMSKVDKPGELLAIFLGMQIFEVQRVRGCVFSQGRAASDFGIVGCRRVHWVDGSGRRGEDW